VVTDDAGVLVSESEHFPFGEEREQTGARPTAYAFTGQELDAAAALYNYGARLYDPVLAVFVMGDTWLPDPTSPQALNRYAYALNSPLLFVDPTGHSPSTAFKLFQVGAGIAEVAMGVAAISTCVTGVGCFAAAVLIVHGLDHAATGAWNIAQDTNVPSQTAQVGAGACGKVASDGDGCAAVGHALDITVGLLAGNAAGPTAAGPAAGAMGEAIVVNSGGVLEIASVPIATTGAVGASVGMAPAAMSAAMAADGSGGTAPKERPRWRPTKERVERVVRHRRFGKFYKNKADGRWWSRDRAGHGGSHWKVFKETDGGLEWISDADEFGDFIGGKHKSDIGISIPWPELWSVSY
jgi:RHS repeat-associated protein